MNISTFPYLVNLNESPGLLNPGESVEGLLIRLDSENYSPSENSVNMVLNFARSYDVINSGATGIIEVNLN